MKKMYIGLTVVAILGLLFVSGCQQPITPPQPSEELRAIDGTTCSSTSDCESKYTMFFTSCSCEWTLNTKDNYNDCMRVCPQPTENKPTSMRCITNVCNLVWD